MKRAFVAGLALALLAGASAATADTGTMHVRVGDLDRTSTSGARQILDRIDFAAKRFCSVPQEFPGSEYQRCRHTMVVKAVTTLDAPLVTAMHDLPQPTRLALR
jgi:UrcA family protein